MITISHLLTIAFKLCDVPRLQTMYSKAEGIWAVDHFVRENDVQQIRERIDALPKNEWYPCPRQEKHYPLKRCSKLKITDGESLVRLRKDLQDAWNGNIDFREMETIAVSRDDSTHEDEGMRHHFHIDTFPERTTGQQPSTTIAIYLTDLPASHPIDRSGATIFPAANLTLAPQKGRMLAWSTLCADKSIAPNALHGVGAYVGHNLPPRLSLHIPVETDVGTGEHVGCDSERYSPPPPPCDGSFCYDEPVQDNCNFESCLGCSFCQPSPPPSPPCTVSFSGCVTMCVDQGFCPTTPPAPAAPPAPPSV